VVLSQRSHPLVVAFAGFGVIAFKRFSLKPSNGRARRPYNSQSTDADIRRDLVVTHGLCHCEYNTENECTGSWDSRSCNLSTFGGIDIFFT
jgi:hypothetical protein